MMNLPHKDLFRPDEVAKYLSIHRGTIYNWISIGKIDSVKVNGVRRIPREAILKIIVPATN